MFGLSNSNNDTNSRSSILGLFEDDFENESSLGSSISSVTSVIAEAASGFISQTADGLKEAVVDLGQNVSGKESKAESNGKFPSKGSIEFNQNKAQIEMLQKQQAEKEKADKKKAFYSSLKEDMERAQRAKDKLLFEEEINDIATNLPTDQKNQLLHYQASYRDRSVYQRAELRRKIIEERRKSEKQKQEASIAAATPKGKSAMQGMFEGASGSQGGGQANLSFQAAG